MTEFPGVDWNEYAETISSAMSSYAQEPITWRRNIRKMPRYGEDEGTTSEDVTLMGLVLYDDWRIWPLNRMTNSGQVDFEHAALMLDKKYLSDNNFLTVDGNFAFDPGLDRFIIKNIIYKPAGDTHLAQAGPYTLIFQILLQREENITAEKMR